MDTPTKKKRPPNCKFWFGKHNGHTIQEVLATDRSYLIWILRSMRPGSQRLAIFQNKLRVALGFPEKDLGQFAPGNGIARRRLAAREQERLQRELAARIKREE